MDNIVVKITAESDMSAATQDFDQLKQKEQEIVRQMDEIKKKSADFAGAPKVIAALDTEYKKLETDLKKTKTSMDAFASSQKNVNDTVANGAVKHTSLRTQIASLREELSRMEMAGQDTSKTYIDLSIRAGQLQDQMGDTRQTIQILSSDTRALDTAMGLGQGLGGAFTAATSAAALLGGENEELQKAFFKVQAVMGVLNGVNEVALMLNKNSVVMVNLRTAAESSSTLAKIKNFGATQLQNVNTAVQTGLESKSTIVKGAATIAQYALNTAVLAFPAFLILAAITAIAAGFVAYSNSANEAERAQNKLNNEAYNFSQDMKERNRLTENNIELMKAQGKSTQEIKAYEIERAEQNKKYYLQQLNFLDATGKATKEQIDEAAKNVTDSGEQLLQIRHKYRVIEVQEQTNAKNKSIQIEKDKQAELKKIAEQKFQEDRAFYTKENEKRIQDETDAEKKLQAALNFAKTPIAREEESEDETSNDKRLKREIKAVKDAEAEKQEIIAESIRVTQELGNMFFDAKQERLSQEMSDLDQFYTTDAEEAKNNTKLKLISEEELAKKKLEIKIKQAKLDKEQALFNIAIGTAVAIAQALPNVALSILAGILGAAQAAVVLAQPLPKYAKGKKAGGKGHFATVGELGAETMWIPDGAAVMPHNRGLNFDTFKDFGVPMDIDSKHIPGNQIDYDKLGQSVGKYIKFPKQKTVTVNVDKSGIAVNEGGNQTTFLNKKYAGQWN
jgi:hypothetical protein